MIAKAEGYYYTMFCNSFKSMFWFL